MKRIALSLLVLVSVLSGAGLARAAGGGDDGFVPKEPQPGRTASAGTHNATTERIYTPLATPCRLYDSRKTGGRFTAGSNRVIPLSGCSAIPYYASALDVSLSSVNPGGSGYLRAWASQAPTATTTLLQWGSTASTTGATVPVDGGGMKVLVSSATDLVVDVAGYYSQAIYADVLTASTTSFGEIYSGSSMIGGWQSSTGLPGQIILTVSRPITYCDIQVTAEATGYTATAVAYSANQIVVNVRDAANNPARTYASLLVTC